MFVATANVVLTSPSNNRMLSRCCAVFVAATRVRISQQQTIPADNGRRACLLPVPVAFVDFASLQLRSAQFGKCIFNNQNVVRLHSFYYFNYLFFFVCLLLLLCCFIFYLSMCGMPPLTFDGNLMIMVVLVWSGLVVVALAMVLLVMMAWLQQPLATVVAREAR